jgi:hypothetical protein
MIADAEKKICDLDAGVARARLRASKAEVGRAAYPFFLPPIDSRRDNLKATLAELDG